LVHEGTTAPSTLATRPMKYPFDVGVNSDLRGYERAAGMVHEGTAAPSTLATRPMKYPFDVGVNSDLRGYKRAAGMGHGATYMAPSNPEALPEIPSAPPAMIRTQQKPMLRDTCLRQSTNTKKSPMSIETPAAAATCPRRLCMKSRHEGAHWNSSFTNKNRSKVKVLVGATPSGFLVYALCFVFNFQRKFSKTPVVLDGNEFRIKL
jgi:hypothetical protein